MTLRMQSPPQATPCPACTIISCNCDFDIIFLSLDLSSEKRGAVHVEAEHSEKEQEETMEVGDISNVERNMETMTEEVSMK